MLGGDVVCANLGGVIVIVMGDVNWGFRLAGVHKSGY